MFSIKWNDTGYSYPGKKGVVLNQKGYTICQIETWAFHSCACFLLQSFESTLLSEDVDKFFEYLTGDLGLTWQPNEIYFLLSTTQLARYSQLYKRKDVKLRDRFTNKAHGPNDVFLFRYSKAGDFKRRNQL
jgi:hypothetical protein